MNLTDEQARALTAEIGRRNREQRSRALADARALAASSGKEPFDLVKLETLCDTSSEGRLDPDEVRQDRFEYMYYVDYPSITTLEEFARKVDEINKW